MGLFGGGDARDVLIETLQSQLERAQEREKELLRQLDQANTRFSALADTKAHLAATRPTPGTVPAAPPRREQQSAPRLPPFVNQLAGGGHFDITKLRDKITKLRNPIGVVPPPIATS